MKKIMLAILIMILFPVYCLAQGEGSFAIVEWNTNKVVVLDFSGNVLFEKDFNGIGVCYFISPSLGGWLVKGCLNYGCQGEDWILWQLQPDGSISNTITGLGPGPFYTGITSGNFITGSVYTGIIDLRNENGAIIDSINVWQEEDGWAFDYNRLGDTAGLVTGGFVVPPEGGWPRSSASYAPYLYYYDDNLNLINKVDITSENIRLFNLIGVSGGGFAGTCADYGASEFVEYLCWFDSEGGLIEKVDVTGDLPYLQYMNVFIAGLSDGRVMLTVYGRDKVWMYDPPSEKSDVGNMEATSAGQMAANYPKVLDLSRSGISGIGAIAGNTFAIDSDDDAVPDVVDNCPNDTNPNQEDTDGDGIGNVCDFDTTSSIYSSTTTTFIFADCQLIISISPPEGGTTSPPPPQYFIMGCQPVTIEALPNPGYTFSHWGGDAQGSDNPVMIEGGGNRSITAVFVIDLCPIEGLYGEDSEQTELLRYFRDNVLSQTPEGQELIKLYYQWSPVIVKVMEEDEKFKEQVKGMIDGILPLIRREVE